MENVSFVLIFAILIAVLAVGNVLQKGFISYLDILLLVVDCIVMSFCIKFYEK